MIKDKSTLVESKFGISLYLVKRYENGKYLSRFYKVRHIEGSRRINEIRKDKVEALALYDRLIVWTKYNIKYTYIATIKERVRELIDYRLKAIELIDLESYNIVKECLILASEVGLSKQYINVIRKQFEHFKFEQYD